MENKLPKGWVETELGSYAYLKNGFAYKSSQFCESGIPILKISNITKTGKIDLKSTQFVNNSLLNENFLVKKGDILIAMSGATTGKFGIFESEEIVLQNQRVGNIKLLNSDLGIQNFLFYIIASKKKDIEELAYGGAQPNVSAFLIHSLRIPLPPLAEQERIANKLDTLFKSIDLIKERMEKIPMLLKDFRQQVLTQAVTGKLTEEWREGKEIKEWEYLELKELCKGFKYGSSAKSLNEGKIAVLRMGNLQNGKLDFSDLKYSNNGLEIEKYRLDSGDVLFNRTNSPELVGKTSIYKGEIPAIYAGYLIKIENNREKLSSEYLNFYMNSHIVKIWCSQVKTDGVSQSNINAKKLSSLKINLPSLLEQNEIVSRVESLFAKADAIENQYNKLKEKVDALPQALLHKAFKGELVEQLPTDGDAADLLREILALKKELVKKTKKK